MLASMGVDDAATRAAQVPVLLEQMGADGSGRVSFTAFAAAASGLGLVPAQPEHRRSGHPVLVYAYCRADWYLQLAAAHGAVAEEDR